MIALFNKSTPYHFVGAFFFASFARLMVSAGWITGGTAFWLIMAGGIALEIVQFERWRAKHPELNWRGAFEMYWFADTLGDVLADAGGAALAIFPGWWY